MIKKKTSSFYIFFAMFLFFSLAIFFGQSVFSLKDTENRCVVFADSLENIFYWELIDGNGNVVEPNGFIFNGKDQRQSIKAYYKSGNLKKYLNVKITGQSIFDGITQNYTNTFIYAGNYIAEIIVTAEEASLNLVDIDGDRKIALTMNKAVPQLLKQDKNFVYDGEDHDVRSLFSVNNDEQTLNFIGDYIFTAVDEGKNLSIKIGVDESRNYCAVTKDFGKCINVVKATSQIDIDGVKKNYIYNGKRQTISSGATINNNEQTLNYFDNSFTNVSEGNNKIVKVVAEESENYNRVEKTFEIFVDKYTINTSSWSWQDDYLEYDGKAKSVRVVGYDKDYVTANYSNNEKTEVGTYVAKVFFVLSDNSNFNPISFPDKIWQINKKKINKPNLSTCETVYSMGEQELNVSDTQYYSFKNTKQTNAGDYHVLVCLKDTKNCEWNDSTIDNLSFKWTIKKKQVFAPKYTQNVKYTGKEVCLNLLENSLYTVLNDNGTEIGSYTSFLVLTDNKNYEWASNPNSNYIELNWKIVLNESYNNSTPTFVIVFALVILLIALVCITLHFTIKSRVKRKKRKLVVETTAGMEDIKFQIEKSTTDTIVLKVESNIDEVVDKNVESQESEESFEKIESVESEKIIDAKNKIEKNEKEKEKQSEGKRQTIDNKQKNDLNSVGNTLKTRKVRMLSMKKNDKKKRRQVENKKIALAKKPPAKRGRPPKKKASAKKKSAKQ